jgi:hypothetical protein
MLSADQIGVTWQIMRVVCVMFLIACSFSSRKPGAGSGSGSEDDAGTPPPDAVDVSPICPSIALGTPVFTASACATPPSTSIDLTASTSIDTDARTSDPPGLSCVRVPNGTGQLCVIAAQSITIEPNVTLSAHGALPLALFARTITIRGTVDVASHLGGTPGAGALLVGCLIGAFPRLAGGGHGGGHASGGGAGGSQGGESDTGGTGTFTFAIAGLVGGCGGTRGGDGTAGGGTDGGATTGGAGGGAVWIAAYGSTGEISIASTGSINASGAGGRGGIADHGGAGGGAGGLIVLQAATVRLDPGGAVFANGGGGGGGAGASSTLPGFTVGADGTDPTGPASGGVGGLGGTDGSDQVHLADDPPEPNGNGASGYPSTPRIGRDGTTDGHGGGGGGGGEGAIRIVSSSRLPVTSVSPQPVYLP